MTNGTINKALLSFAVLAAILIATGIISALIAQHAAAEKISSGVEVTQKHSCHYKVRNAPILNSCNDIVRGSSDITASKGNTK
jgi:hypothetical protein